MTQVRSKGWWYPLIFFAFFAVVFCVDTTMAYFASHSLTGLTTQHPYNEGVTYNRDLSMARAQAALGWQVQTTVTPAAGTAPAALVDISYRDRDGKPIDGMTVEALISRPTVVGFERKVTLTPQGNGHYGTTLGLAMAGQWDMDVLATGKDSAYQLQHRFFLP